MSLSWPSAEVMEYLNSRVVDRQSKMPSALRWCANKARVQRAMIVAALLGNEQDAESLVSAMEPSSVVVLLQMEGEVL